MNGGGFGRKGAGPDPDLAARRAAFLAAERERRAAAPPPGPERRLAASSPFGPPPTTERPYAPRKTIGTAYLLWFAFGGFSAHRFYLGLSSSAFVQLLLAPIGYALLVTKSPIGMMLVSAAALWLLLDAILIPGMVTKANERARELSLATTFA